MEDFASYILNEKELAGKMEIMYYLAKKSKFAEVNNIYFEKAVILKTEIVRLFIKYMKLDIDENLILTASLLCNCKKVDNAQNKEKLLKYAKEGAEFLNTLGFDRRFCKICEEINRYSGSFPRERESDILELADQFGGMLLDRPERAGYQPDEAITLIEHRNLKDIDNIFLNDFKTFVEEMEQIEIVNLVAVKCLNRLVKMFYECKDLKKYIEKVTCEFEPKVDELINERRKKILYMKSSIENPNRPLFSKETTRKIMKYSENEDKVNI